MSTIIVKMDAGMLGILQHVRTRNHTLHPTGARPTLPPEPFAKRMLKFSEGTRDSDKLVNTMDVDTGTDQALLESLLEKAGILYRSGKDRITIQTGSEHDPEVVCAFDSDGNLVAIRSRY